MLPRVSLQYSRDKLVAILDHCIRYFSASVFNSVVTFFTSLITKCVNTLYFSGLLHVGDEVLSDKHDRCAFI